jgi:hypothetical protein
MNPEGSGGTRYVEYLMMKYCAAVKSKISKIIQQK